MYFSPDSDNSKNILVVFNLTNGNSNNLLSPLPNVTLSPNSSQKVVTLSFISDRIDKIIPRFQVDISPLKAGHVDVVAWPQSDEDDDIR